MKINSFKKKIKEFIKRHYVLYTMVFFFWGISCILRAKFIFKKIKHSSPNKNFKVIILGLRTIPTTNLVYYDAIFGHAFKKLGCTVKILYCDGVLDSCDANTIFRNQKPQCFLCKNLGCFLKDSLNLDCISFKQYISNSDIEEIKKDVVNLTDEKLLNYKYLGVNVGAHAHSSAIRYFLFGKIDMNNPNQIAVLREKLVYAMIVTKVAEGVVLKEKPNMTFMVHGIYSTWGPFVDYFRNKNIDVIIYGNNPVRFGHSNFSRNGREFEFTTQKSWEKFRQKHLSEDKKLQIDNYLYSRFKGLVSDHLMYKDNFNNSKKQTLLKQLFKGKYLRHYVFYSNMAWDACVDGRGSIIFKDIFNCIDTTIEYFKKRKDYQLIIKPHPSELIWENGTRGIRDYILNKYPDLPDNIVVLNNDTPLGARDLILSNTIAITFNGTIGLELATQGLPTLVTGDSHYMDAGVVFKIWSLKEYLDLLDNPERVISFVEDNIELAKKYAYFYFFKTLVRIPFYRDNNWAVIDWKTVADTKKLLADNSDIIKICKKIIDREDIVVPL